MPCTSSSRRWLWILLEEAAGHLVQRTKLLWGIWQRRRYDERRWEFVMFIPGMSLRLTSRFLYKDELVQMRKKLQLAKKLFLPLDIETRREETKVRLRWHEHWQARNSSKEAEEEVNVPTRIFRVQQVRAALTVHQRLTLPPLSEKYQTPIRSYECPVRFVFLRYHSLRRLESSHYPHAGDDVGGYGVLGGVFRGSPYMDLFCVCSNQGQRCWKGLM